MSGTEPDTETAGLLYAGGNALARQAWDEARAFYERALEGEESAEALEGLAVASWWADDVTAAIDARERAFLLRREAGQTIEAARLASFLAWDYGAMRGASAVANGWLQRARRLAADVEPSAEQAWLPLIEASFHLDTDAEAVLRLSGEALALARAYRGIDIEMTARTLRGLALVSLGRLQEGTRLLDEGTAAATAGELHDPIAIGSCCCNMIIACERSRDFVRAGQWCEQLSVFCERTGQRPLLALCRAHDGVIQMMRGRWSEAESELEWAAGALSTLRPPLAGYARARLAELRRRQGRRRAAGALLDSAGDHVLVPLVRAALALDEDDPSAALGHAERYVRSLGGEQPIESAAALELMVPIGIRLEDLALARRAHFQLGVIADAVANDALRAAERCAAGEIALAVCEPDAARRALEDALAHYKRSVQPFETAHVHVALAHALAAQGRADAALEQARSAFVAFDELGAERAARDADKLVRRLGGQRVAAKRAGLTPREVEVLALVAEGLSNRQIAERLVVSEHTVHRHMANIYVKLGVSSRAAAVAVAAQQQLL